MLVLLALIVIFCVQLSHFYVDDMIYFSRYTLLGSADIKMDVTRDLFRFSIGMTGSIMVLLFLHLVMRLGLVNPHLVNGLTSVGKMTFGIYVFQDLLQRLLTPLYKHMHADYYIANGIFLFIILLSLSLLLTWYSNKNKIMGLLFLGKGSLF